MNYAQVLPLLFIGSYPQSADDVDRLRQESSITAVLNLQTDEDLRSLNLDWGTLETHYAVCGIALCRVPVNDFDVLDLREKLPECVRALDSLLAAGHSVYLHCTAGAARSPTVAAAYLHWCRAWDLDRAVEYLKRCRDCSPSVEAIRLAKWEHVNDRNAARPSPSPGTS